MKHHSTEELESEDDRIISLNDCLCKFHDVERLSEKLQCSECEEPMPHQKSFETFRLPPILIIQLKRFKNVDGAWKKL